MAARGAWREYYSAAWVFLRVLAAAAADFRWWSFWRRGRLPARARAGGCPLGLARPRRRRSVALRPGVDQGDGLIQRDGVRRLVGWQRRVDAVVADIRAIAAFLGHDGAALGRVVTDGTARIGAEAALARPLGDFLGDQRHRPVEADGKGFLGGVEIGVGLAMLHIGSETADAGADRFAVFGVASDFARQREKSERAFEIHILGRRSFRQTGALRLFFLGAFAELHIGAEAAAAHGDVQAGFRILAELFGADIGRAVGRRRQRPGVAALRIIRAADERAELAQLERELAIAAGRTDPRIDAIGALRVEMLRQQRIERVDDLRRFSDPWSRRWRR